MATARKLENMTSAQLVEVYNSLGPKRPLKSWSKSKGLLIERINSAKKQSSAVEKKAGSSRTGEIRDFCEAKLQEIAYHENKDKDVGPDNQLKRASKNTRPVGLSFAEILGQVNKAFPDHKTSYACLRWYATHLRHSGVSLPRRPKSSWK